MPTPGYRVLEQNTPGTALYLPSSFRTDKSVPRIWLGDIDPSNQSGTLLAIGDRWYDTLASSIAPPDSFVAGTTRPVAANTGLNVQGLTTADLTVQNGTGVYYLINDALISSRGSNTWDKFWFKCSIVNEATQPVFIKNSLIEGVSGFTPSIRTSNNVPTYNGGHLDAAVHSRRTDAASADGLINLENCQIKIKQPDLNLSAASGERLGYFKRCDISLGSDGLDYWSTDYGFPNVIGCYFHDHTVWVNDSKHSTDGTHPYWSHNDFVQYSGGNGGYIFGNFFDVHFNRDFGDWQTFVTGDGNSAPFPYGNYGSGVILTPGTRAISNIEIAYNWFTGAECQCFFPFQTAPGAINAGSSWNNHHNRYSPNSHIYNSNAPYSLQIARQGVNMGLTPDMFHDNIWDLEAPSAISMGIAGQATPSMLPVPAPPKTAGQYECYIYVNAQVTN